MQQPHQGSILLQGKTEQFRSKSQVLNTQDAYQLHNDSGAFFQCADLQAIGDWILSSSTLPLIKAFKFISFRKPDEPHI